MRKMRLSLSLSLIALMMCNSISWAQTSFGNLRGSVVDQGGATITNAKVTLLEESTGVSRSAVTSAAGEYVFANINPSTYTVTVEQSGFKKTERKGIVVATQQYVTLDVKLEVGDVSQSIMVTEETPLLETASASTGQVVDRQKLIDLPNLGRNPFMMSRLAPTVVQVGNPAYARMQDQSGSSQISIVGGPVRGNNYLLDGIPITDFANRAIIIPSLEAVEEMKVQISTYDSEMGRTGGGVFNTYLKSGGNTYHGSLFGYMRQTSWLANTFFNNRNGRAITNQPFRNYGGSFGGKVWIPKVYDGKNKTFFWLGFEGYRDTQAASREQYTPTAAERVGDFSRSLTNSGAPLMIYDPFSTTTTGSRTAFPNNIIPSNRLDPVGRNIAATYELPTKAARFYGDNNLAGAGPLASVADQRFIKLDHTLFSWWRANLSYLGYNSDEPGENPYPSISSPDQWILGRRVNTTQLNNTITPNATTVIAVRYGFNRFPNIGTQKSQNFNVASLGFSNSFVRDIPSQTFPNVGMQTAYSLGTNNNFNYVHHSNNLGVNLSKFLGKHSLKLGYDYRKLANSGLDLGNSSGTFNFNLDFTRSGASTGTGGADIASMLLGAPSTAQGFIPTKLFQFVKYYGMYIQDDYRVSKKLTLNLGLRWERESGLQERNNNLITTFDEKAANPLQASAGVPTLGVFRFAGVNGAPTQTSNYLQNKFAPRVGVAYQLNDKTILRGGYGIYWAPAIALGSPFNSEGITALTNPATDNGGLPLVQLSNPFPNGLDKPVGNSLGDRTGIGKAMNVYAPDATSGRVQQFSIDVQRQLPGGMVVVAGYAGSRSKSLTWTAAGLNVNQLNPSFFSQGATLRQTVPNPYFGRGGANVTGTATIERQRLLRPFPAYDAVNYLNQSYVRADYNAINVRVQKNASNGLTLLTAFTFSKNMDNAGGGAGNNLNSGNAGPQNVYDLEAEYSRSYLDSPRRWTNALTYELPVGKGKRFLGNLNRMGDILIGGWSINAVSTFQTGYPLMVFANANLNAPFGAARQRPNLTGTAPAAEGSFAKRIDGWLNPAAFSNAAIYTFGNAPRAIDTRGPGQANWDISVFKTVTVFENFKAQFRAEALNSMNTPHFRGPNTAFGNAQFGRITSQANFPRMLQLGLRLFF
ncbi:MAG: TonB-dependent receptor [Acidobacteria bacterium]|nr:TonB-dependent receptor [Acidobacteriota bacterium]